MRLSKKSCKQPPTETRTVDTHCRFVLCRFRLVWTVIYFVLLISFMYLCKLTHDVSSAANEFSGSDDKQRDGHAKENDRPTDVDVAAAELMCVSVAKALLQQQTAG